MISFPTSYESSSDVILSDVKNGWLKDRALVVALHHFQTVRKWRDFKHVQEGRLGLADLVTRFEQVNGTDDFNGTTGNLGLDGQSLEETGLLGSHTGVLGGDDDIDRRDGAGTGRSGNFVLKNLVTDLLEVAVGEHETDVLDEERDRVSSIRVAVKFKV